MSNNTEAKQNRLEHTNELIKIIAAHGRRFFFCQKSGRTAELFIGKRGRIWLADEYTGTQTSLHHKWVMRQRRWFTTFMGNG